MMSKEDRKHNFVSKNNLGALFVKHRQRSQIDLRLDFCKKKPFSYFFKFGTEPVADTGRSTLFFAATTARSKRQ
jgi:hypothetical protein